MYKTTLLVVNVIFEGHARIIIKKSPVNLATYRTLAEREGFEPPVPLGTTVFKTVVIDHSTISPCKMTSLVFLSGCKGTTIFSFCQIFMKLFLIFLKKVVLRMLVGLFIGLFIQKRGYRRSPQP